MNTKPPDPKSATPPETATQQQDGPQAHSETSGDDMPAWADNASAWMAWRYGLRAALGVPGWVLVATSVGYGALAADTELGLGLALFLCAALYALPAQVILVDQLARGASMAATALAVCLTAIRLIPMTVALVPYFRKGQSVLLQIAAVHFIAITAWIEGRRRLPLLPPDLRLPHYLGIGCGLMVMTLMGTALGYYLAGRVTPEVSAALLFTTPIYFLCSLIGTAQSRAQNLAIAFGAVLGPLAYMAVPGFDLLLTGLVGGTFALVPRRPPKPANTSNEPR